MAKHEPMDQIKAYPLCGSLIVCNLAVSAIIHCGNGKGTHAQPELPYGSRSKFKNPQSAELDKWDVLPFGHSSDMENSESYKPFHNDTIIAKLCPPKKHRFCDPRVIRVPK